MSQIHFAEFRTIDYIKCRDAKASFAVVRPRQGLNLSEVRMLPFI
jgi:hypothetical protein